MHAQFRPTEHHTDYFQSNEIDTFNRRILK